MLQLDGAKVNKRPFTVRTNDNDFQMQTFIHPFRIESGLSADPDVGRVQSWNSAKTIKVMAREYSSSYQAKLHNFLNGSAPDTSTNSTNIFAAPMVGIRTLGIRE